MKEIVEAKVSQCLEFHDVLKNPPPKAVFVESTYDDFWGSGLNIAGTKHTNKTACRPGKNMLGDIITKLSKKKKPGLLRGRQMPRNCVSVGKTVPRRKMMEVQATPNKR